MTRFLVLALLLAGCATAETVDTSFDSPRDVARALGCRHFHQGPSSPDPNQLPRSVSTCDFAGSQIEILWLPPGKPNLDMQEGRGAWVRGTGWAVVPPNAEVGERVVDWLRQPGPVGYAAS